jgi:hypothetical protein
MTSEQITEWEAYYRISPWDGDRTEYMIASFMQLYASAHRKPGSARPELDSFLMFLRKTDEEKEEEAFNKFFEAHREE